MNTARNIERLGWIAEHDPLTVTVWSDPVIDQLGHHCRSGYVESYWLPILGPSALLAARRLGEWLEGCPGGIEVPLEQFGRSLGLTGRIGRQSAIVRTLGRLVTFGMASIAVDDYRIRSMFPPLAARQIHRLPGYLAAQHDAEHGLKAAS